jgi:hypothetical protein
MDIAEQSRRVVAADQWLKVALSIWLWRKMHGAKVKRTML